MKARAAMLAGEAAVEVSATLARVTFHDIAKTIFFRTPDFCRDIVVKFAGREVVVSHFVWAVALRTSAVVGAPRPRRRTRDHNTPLTLLTHTRTRYEHAALLGCSGLAGARETTTPPSPPHTHTRTRYEHTTLRFAPDDAP